MSARITIETEIPATPDQVWSAVEDLSTHTEWMADAEAITFVTEQRAGVGTEFDCLTVVGPLRTTDRMQVTEWEPGAVMGIEHRGAVTGRGRFTLEPSPRGTTFRWSEELSFPWWLGGPVGELAGKPVLTWVWRRNLDRLRTHVMRTVQAP
ncbi:MAG: SRPBCC family protein [Actinobacteria bacterium]|nr:SRPBCC family protein [Actinomycetota bacterium]